MKVLTGDNKFTFDSKPVNYLLNDFWAWQASDLLNNTMRGALAEFIVAKALGISTAETRQDWHPYDLFFEDLWRIEVKSSAFLQSWKQKTLSRPQFAIRPARAWTAESAYEDEVRRQSDLYVFCVFIGTDRAIADPLNLNQWNFYVLSTKSLDGLKGSQKTITLTFLLKLAPLEAEYGILAASVRLALARAYPERSTYDTDELEREIREYEMLGMQRR